MGYLLGQAEAKHGWGDRLVKRARTVGNRELSKRSAIRRRQTRDDRDEALSQAARVYRLAHPTHSARSMARNLAPPLDVAVGTVRGDLRRLGINSRSVCHAAGVLRRTSSNRPGDVGGFHWTSGRHSAYIEDADGLRRRETTAQRREGGREYRR
jgi:hypothetical protein